jgi:hypothetical protein
MRRDYEEPLATCGKCKKRGHLSKFCLTASSNTVTTDGSPDNNIKKSSKSDPKKPAVKSSVSKKSHKKPGNNNAKRKTALRQKTLKKSLSYVVDHVLSRLNEEGEVDDEEEFDEDGQSEPGEVDDETGVEDKYESDENGESVRGYKVSVVVNDEVERVVNDEVLGRSVPPCCQRSPCCLRKKRLLFQR